MSQSQTNEHDLQKITVNALREKISLEDNVGPAGGEQKIGSRIHSRIHGMTNNVKMAGGNAEGGENNVTHRRRNQDLGDLKIRGLWERGTYCVLDVRVTNLNSKTYRKRDNACKIYTKSS